MVIAGHMSDFPLAELLFFLSSRQRSGWLVLRNRSTTITLMLRGGRLIAAQTSDVNHRLGCRLVDRGVLPSERLEIALSHQAREARRAAIGLVVVDLGYVGRSIVQRTLQEQIGALLTQLFVNSDGRFTFKPGDPDPGGVEIDLSVEREVLSAVHRADEWISHDIEAGPLLLLSGATSADRIEPVALMDWPIVEAMRHGARTLDAVAIRAGMSRDETLEALLRLHTLRIVGIDGAAAANDTFVAKSGALA